MRGFFRAESILRVQTLTRAGLQWGHRNILLYPCIVSVRNWIGNYYYFSEATTRIRALVCSHSFINHALVNILITYLTDNWSTSHFEMAALVTNVQEGVSGIMVIVLAQILDSPIGSIEFLPLYFTVLRDFSSFLISFLYNLLIPKHWRKATGTLTLVRIGCGLACSMLCCVAAWQVEGKRLRAISNEGLEDDMSTTIPMSISWLLPQFVLLGVMEGLALNGLTDFLADRIANNDALRATYYASHISDLILGVGKLITASTIILFRRSWFHHNINGSRLDRFFELLTYLSLVNLIYYGSYLFSGFMLCKYAL
ncbi:hypothetical protein PRUPE_1G125000 [Prunus persica]|uniref:Uncharacterized protein n=1 Tax=Prunus persica TaxID=3760 RepID=M5XIQ1_PRUPE|nr:hypothetical protein PRUPE_1G125000 [Prunus persica]